MSTPLLKVFVNEGRIEFWCAGCNQLLYALEPGNARDFAACRDTIASHTCKEGKSGDTEPARMITLARLRLRPTSM